MSTEVDNLKRKEELQQKGQKLLKLRSLIPPILVLVILPLLAGFLEKAQHNPLLLAIGFILAIGWLVSEYLAYRANQLIPTNNERKRLAPPSKTVTNILLTEYREAREMATHQDKIIWQIGAILIAGSLAGLGFSVNKDTLPMYGIAIDSAAIVALTSWLMFVGRNRGFFAIYSARMREIERVLGMKAQIYIEDAQSGYVAPDGKLITFAKPTGWTIARFLAIGLVVLLLWAISLLARKI